MALAFEQSKTMVPVLFMLSMLLRFEEGLVCAQKGYPPQEEVNALKEIADQLGKRDWNFNLPPCNNNSNWVAPARKGTPLYNSTVYCNCSNANGECHVTHIILRGQELTGTLPASLAKLPYIKYINFAFNDISGSIPPEWASTKLEFLAVTGNHLSGQIPESLGNITSLRYMSLEQNLFNGTVPAALGKLINLENLILNSNNLSGTWPIELSKLSNLKELRLSSNNFTGSMPSFQNWKQLKQLELQGSGFEGPVHSSISLLTDLIELRISDLNGGVSEFPPLQGLNNLTRLMLRSCSISGPIPSYIGHLTMLRDLDLSFNNLNGEIPNLEGLQYLERLYLTSNWLSGNIPDWIKNSNPRLRVDLSYNNFAESSAPPACLETINLFRSFSARNMESGPCLERFPCTKDWYSFRINCGGENTCVGDTKYDADELEGDLAKFFPLQEQWGTSMTGHFLDRNLSRSNYIAKNVSALRVNSSGLYTSARVSPLSLTYYGRCLANGNYTVTLNFAEIVFTSNRSYQSLGRRIFDVYIQDELVLSNFDIKHEASGVAKEVQKQFKANVKNRTLEIRFHWAGKGTTAVPIRGHYGPLISAISVEAGFKPPSGGKDKRFIVVGVVALVFCCLILLLFLWRKGYLGSRPPLEPELRGLDLQTGIFTFRQIKAATNNFAAENKLGEGGFGSVYKGILSDGTVIAVKQLSSKSKQGNKEFVNEIGMVSGLRHPNLVRLYGCCIEGNQLLLVYEYMEKNNLAFALFGPEKLQISMDWPTRQRICVGIAKGLAFLHEESVLKIVHRDIKATNVLLDKDLTPKISDFGLAKLYEEENTHVSTRVAGTIGYMAPEYALWGYLTSKADVYSFGVVALELVAGKNNMKYRPDENYVCLLDWALVLQKRGNLLELVDPRLNSNFNKDEALRMIKIALLCTSPSPALRPIMSSVVGMLEGCISVEELNTNTTSDGDDLKFKGLREKYDELRLYHSNESEPPVDSSDASLHNCSTSSKSTHGLYPASSISV